jgi:hypothetical protein
MFLKAVLTQLRDNCKLASDMRQIQFQQNRGTSLQTISFTHKEIIHRLSQQDTVVIII